MHTRPANNTLHAALPFRSSRVRYMKNKKFGIPGILTPKSFSDTRGKKPSEIRVNEICEMQNLSCNGARSNDLRKQLRNSWSQGRRRVQKRKGAWMRNKSVWCLPAKPNFTSARPGTSPKYSPNYVPWWRSLRMTIAKPVIPWWLNGLAKYSTLILVALSRGIRLGWENPPQRHLNIATSSTSRCRLTPSTCKRVVPRLWRSRAFQRARMRNTGYYESKKKSARVVRGVQEENIIRVGSVAFSARQDAYLCRGLNSGGWNDVFVSRFWGSCSICWI